MSDWKLAAAGGLGGGALALAVVLGLAASGRLPVPDKPIHDYLMAHPEILVAMSDKLQSQQEEDAQNARQAAVDKLGMKAFFNPKLAFITGPQNAKITIVEFFDYNCPFCRQSVPALQKYYETHKDKARFAFIEFPIKGPQSLVAARAALAARKQPDKYIPFHFMLMKEDGEVDAGVVIADAQKAGLDLAKLQADMNDPTLDAAIAASHSLAEAAKVDGTPTFIVNGKVHAGAVDDAVLKKMTKT